MKWSNISDKVFQANDIALDKAICMAQDLTDDYFGMDEVKPEDHWKLAYNYRQGQTRAFILFDYLHEARELLKEVEEDMRELMPNKAEGEDVLALRAMTEGLAQKDMELLRRMADVLRRSKSPLEA